MRGKIFAINQKGYGFISSEEQPFTRIFFHWTHLATGTRFIDLKKNQYVEFDLVDDDRGGYSAIRVSLIDNPLTEAQVDKLDTNKDYD